MIKRLYKIKRFHFPIDNIYNYNAQVWVSVDGGVNFVYCGIGKHCRTEHEAIDFCTAYERSYSTRKPVIVKE